MLGFCYRQRNVSEKTILRINAKYVTVAAFGGSGFAVFSKQV